MDVWRQRTSRSLTSWGSCFGDGCTITLAAGTGMAWLTGGATCRFGVCGLLYGAGLMTGRGGSDGWSDVAPVPGIIIAVGAAGRGVGATGCDVACDVDADPGVAAGADVGP
jgi:hypothetical protein